MAAKRLEDGSDYAEYDADGDGIVTDEELQTSKELQELRLQHERADAQRAMSWFALWGMLLYPSLVVVSEFFGMKPSGLDSGRYGCGLLCIRCRYFSCVLWRTSMVE
jgi:hypothetical protein